ncbi:opsin-VA-like [Vidua macroura]|uniref:opsin-VA-like n=1 Tax=Vidua macroura TaxID=187451 RepID=UPI0023A82237|nr:opsin-VA-like [Vidua macroura]
MVFVFNRWSYGISGRNSHGLCKESLISSVQARFRDACVAADGADRPFRRVVASARDRGPPVPGRQVPARSQPAARSLPPRASPGRRPPGLLASRPSACPSAVLGASSASARRARRSRDSECRPRGAERLTRGTPPAPPGRARVLIQTRAAGSRSPRSGPAETPLSCAGPMEQGIVALWSLALLAFERYVVICRPLRNARLRGKHAALGIVFVWSFSFIWTILPTTGWSSYTTSKIGTTCEPNWYSGAYADRTYIITFFTTCFIVPLLVILVSYGKLVRKLKKVSDAQGRLGTTRRPERQVTRMVVFMIVAFLICWMPYATFSILVTAYPSIELDPCLAAIPAFFSKTATVYNPIIYVFMNKQFRQCLIQMFSCSAIGTAESNMNLTSERAALPQDRRGSERAPMAVHSTISKRKTGDEHRSRQPLALLTASENKKCPM